MRNCPKCRVPVGDTQRLCRACGCNLEQARSSGGLLGRFRRWLAGGRQLLAGAPRFAVSVRVRREGQEDDETGAVNPGSLPPDGPEAIKKARLDAPGGDSAVKVTSMGPVKVTTRTTTTTRTYHSLDEMPPELRQRAEAALKGGTAPSATAITVTINGEKRTYSRIEDVPEPYRQALAQARQKTSPR